MLKTGNLPVVVRHIAHRIRDCWQKAGLSLGQQLWLAFMLMLATGLLLAAWPGLTLFSGLFLIVMTSLLGWAAWTWPAMQISVVVTVCLALFIVLTSLDSQLSGVVIVVMGVLLVAALVLTIAIEYGTRTLRHYAVNMLGWAVIVCGVLTSVLRWSAEPNPGLHYANLPLTSPLEVLLWAVVVMVFLYLHFLRTQTRSQGAWFGLLPATLLGLYLVWHDLTYDPGQQTLPAAVIEHGLLLVHVPVMIVAFALLMNAAAIALLYLLSGSAWLRRRQNRDVLETHQHSLGDYLYRLMALAIILLGVGLLTGMVWSNLAWGHYWYWDAKPSMSLAVWFYALAGLHLRLQKGMQTRAFAWWCVGGIPVAIGTFIGTNLWPQGLHTFGSL